jgi:heme-degrading monooxygenase HmoA
VSQPAGTPEPPYVAVIFSSVRTGADPGGYAETAARMEELAGQQPGYLGIESAREDAFGITVSYWTTMAAARAWKLVAEHLAAQELGREVWYRTYRVRIAEVQRDYGPPA